MTASSASRTYFIDWYAVHFRGYRIGMAYLSTCDSWRIHIYRFDLLTSHIVRLAIQAFVAVLSAIRSWSYSCQNDIRVIAIAGWYRHEC